MKAPLPADETVRLRILRGYQVLDTGSETSFDDLAGLAAHVVQTPAAMVTFLDESRQWFKASRGIPFRETDRDLSFCAHAILASDVLVVPDATKDARFCDNALVTGPPFIRFYAGAPLQSPEGCAVGTLAVIDFTPRQATAEQVGALRVLSQQVMAQLELRRHLSLKQQRVAEAEASLQTAAEQHRAMVDSALDAIVTMDASGRVREFNVAAERMFGYRQAEAVGQLLADLIIPPEYVESHARGLARYLRTGDTVLLGRRVELTAMRRDRTRFPVEMAVHRLGPAEPALFTGFIRDISERTRVTQELRRSAAAYQAQRLALSTLIQDEGLHRGDPSAALRHITSTVAQTLKVGRVSVWQYDDDHAALRSLDLYELPADRHSSGAELRAAAVPAYFEAIRQGRVIAATDARHDARTSDLTAGYLAPLEITSRLDAPIHLHGTLHGVLCLEHVGGLREWTPEEETFAVATATLVSLSIEGYRRRQAQDALMTQAELLTAVTESLAAYVERDDWKAAFGRLLRCALTVTESEYGFVGVVVEGPVLRVLAHEGIVWDKVLNREFYDQALRHYDEHGYLTFHNFDNLFGRAISTGAVVIANEPSQDPRAKGRPAGHPPMNSFIGVPIRARDNVTGLIALANRRDGYGQEERRRIETLVQQAGGLCEAYRQRERAQVQDAERRQVEAALRASEERLRLVARATNDAVWEWNLETDAIVMPEGFQKLFGDDAGPIQTTPDTWFARVHADDLARIAAGIQSAIASGAQVWSDEYRFRRTDGTYAAVFNRGFLLRNAEGRPVRVIGAMMDVSERKKLEAQFRQAQRLEAVGQLAGGVAHDFNNLLTVIQGHASLLLGNAHPDEEVTESIREISEAAERAAGLTRQLLAFSRKQVLQATDLDLNETVASMTRLLQRILGEHIALEIVSSTTPAWVCADASMMEQVIMNLAINARDAMPGGGRLVLETALEQIEAAGAPEHAEARPGSFVRLTVSDSGCGIPADVLPHIFEPFFTTKGAEGGTGLGLATVYGVVKQHRGWATVRSVEGTGTSISVLLPAVAEAPEASRAGDADVSDGAGQETILVVEDEASVRRLASLMLERRGYTVLEADSGPAALALWQRHAGRIDLVLTDMVMPDGMSGLELAHRLLGEQSRLQVLITSGYSVDLAGKDFAPTGRVRFLAKPYSVHQLAQAVRASLDAR